MQTLLFTQPNNLNLLHDELVAGISGFHRTHPRPDGTNEADPDCGQVQGTADEIIVTFADDIPPQLVTAVVQAHDHTMTQPDPRKDRRARIAELKAIPRSTWTTAQIRELIDLMAQELTP